MTKIVPHAAFEVTTPDVVAECWNGVFSNETCPNLYELLWNCVPSYKAFDREDCGPADVVGLNSVKDFWDTFPPVAQEELNKLAVAQDAYLERMIGGL